ncbi:MAG: hypothetical protein GX121_05980 [Ignavibacteria bacterium]|nr:hypothetical protein [Ignavibacteria bacterium]
MEIREIWNSPLTQLDLAGNKPSKTQTEQTQKEIKDTKTISTAESPESLSAWQKDILLDVVNKLENNTQVNNNHPLGKANYEPIESLEEALIELAYIKSPFFKQHALETQANLTAEQVLPLFTME